MNKTFTIVFFLFLLNLNAQESFNYDESLVPDFELPKILVENNGTNVNDVQKWESVRRKEILDIFLDSVYGRIPDFDYELEFELVRYEKNVICNLADLKEVKLIIKSSGKEFSYSLLIFLPSNRNGAVPIFMGYNFYGNHTVYPSNSITIGDYWVGNKPEFCIFNNSLDSLSRGVRNYRWPIDRIIQRGYGLATICYNSVDPDFDDDFKNGLHSLLYSKEGERPDSNEWGSISTWAFGLMRAMDYLEKDNDIDATKVAVLGHSRLAKTALLTGAMDQRFALVISNNSGCVGAALSKRRYGETVNRINDHFPHWFCDNFNKFSNNEDKMTFDQHMFLALLAPRPLYIASAVDDKWADPKGEFLSAKYASVVYKLYNKEVYLPAEQPEINQAVKKGYVGYHIRTGKHDITKFDWEQYLDFADYHFSNH